MPGHSCAWDDEQAGIRGRPVLSQTPAHRSPEVGGGSAVTILKFFWVLERGALCFHVQVPANCVLMRVLSAWLLVRHVVPRTVPGAPTPVSQRAQRQWGQARGGRSPTVAGTCDRHRLFVIVSRQTLGACPLWGRYGSCCLNICAQTSLWVCVFIYPLLVFQDFIYF